LTNAEFYGGVDGKNKIVLNLREMKWIKNF
jgi:hypothetical protein